MKLRLILIVLSLLAFLSASTGGYLYYSSLKESALKEAERQADLRLRTIKKNLTTFLSENVKPVKTLAGMPALRLALNRPDAYSGYNATATVQMPILAPEGLYGFQAARKAAEATRANRGDVRRIVPVDIPHQLNRDTLHGRIRR